MQKVVGVQKGEESEWIDCGESEKRRSIGRC
jgi:hypothetical protein